MTAANPARRRQVLVDLARLHGEWFGQRMHEVIKDKPFSVVRCFLCNGFLCNGNG